jgi:hypothetical protein
MVIGAMKIVMQSIKVAEKTVPIAREMDGLKNQT